MKAIVCARPLKQPCPFLNHSPAWGPVQCELADGRYGIEKVLVFVSNSPPGVVSPPVSVVLAL